MSMSTATIASTPRPQGRGGLGVGGRISVALMLGLLGGLDIWIFTAAKISSLPQVQVQVTPGKLQGALPGTQPT